MRPQRPVPHPAEHGMAAVQDPVEVQVDVLGPLAGVHVGEGPDPHALGDAGVVDQDVDGPDGGDPFGHGLAVGHVEGGDGRPRHGVGHGGGAVGVEVVHGHGGAVRGQRPHDALADALTASGDEGPAAREVEGGHQPKLIPPGLVPFTIDSARAVTIGFSSSWGRIQNTPSRTAAMT